MSGSEEDFRLTNLVTSYGVGTRSYNRSAEKREMERQRRAATASYQHEEIVVGPYCRCRSFERVHELRRHGELRAEWDWRTEEEREWEWTKES
jgi:hypothetical protein